jgi:hypothetical protein
MTMVGPVVDEDRCDTCHAVIRGGEECRQVTQAGSIDQAGRIRYQFRHTTCESVAGQILAEVPPVAWSDWLRLLSSDPFGAAERLHDLEQRVAALEVRRR